jgi:hypothetical protein
MTRGGEYGFAKTVIKARRPQPCLKQKVINMLSFG